MEDIIVDDLLNKIIKGVFTPDLPLPSENSLSRRFNVSRMMVRKAYGQLEERGYIRSIRGKGRFLFEPKQHVLLDLRSDMSFTEKLKAMGTELVTHNIEVKAVDYNSKIWSSLEADRNEQVFSVMLMRLLNKEPIAIHTSYLRAALFPDIWREGRSIISMYSYLSEHGYSNFSSTNTTMNVTLPTLQEQEVMGCPSLVPLLLLEYETTCQQIPVIQYNKIVYRSDRFKYRI